MKLSPMPPKTVALIGATCLTTGWLLASVLTPPVAKLQMLPERRPNARQATSSESPAAFSEQLRWKLQQAPVAPTPRRNPFVFAGRARATSLPASQPVGTETPAPDLTVAAPRVGPIFSLSGIGVHETPQGGFRTAVLSDGTTVHLARTGDLIAGYKVLEVTDSTVTLADAAGVQTVLRLR